MEEQKMNNLKLYNNIFFPKTETSILMEPIHSNIHGNVHGGELMKIMDTVAGITATKHCKGIVVTARIDEIVFHKPIHVGNVITCISQLAYVGNSSMEILVRVLVHEIENYSEPEIALTAFFTMVHLVDNKPAKVPELAITTKEDEELYKLGEKKHKEIKTKHISL